MRSENRCVHSLFRFSWLPLITYISCTVKAVSLLRTRIPIWRPWLAIWLGLLLLTPAAISQTAVQNTVSGNVLDPALASIKGAQVTLVRADGSPVAATTTDETGAFSFERLPAGRYRLSVTIAGFKRFSRDISIGSKNLPALRIVLEIATQSESVNVSTGDATQQLSTDVSENQNANSFERDALDRVPVFDQDYITTISRFLDDNAAGTNGVSLVVDGVEANGPGVSPSGVQEVKVNQNPYSARFARPGRARLEITTKGGTPQFHGTVNFLFRDSVFDAQNAFAETKPAERRQFYEGSLTGPLGRNPKNTFLLTMDRDQNDVQAIVSAIGANNSPIHDNVPAPERHLFASFRAFHDFANGDQVWIGYFFESETRENQGVGGSVLREAGYTQIGREHEVNISYRHIFSPKWVNQLRFLVGHNDNPITSANPSPQLIVEGFFTSGGAQADFNRTESHFDGTDFLTYTNGKHVLTFGVDVPDLSRRGFDNRTNSLGTYTFGSLADFNATTKRPATFLQQQGPGHVIFWERTTAGFLEDNIRLKPNLSVSLGVRYYFQNYFHNDPNNFAPRLSLAYAPSKKSKTVFRTGAGVFFDRTGPRPIADLLLFNGVNVQRFLLSSTLANPLPFPVTSADLAGVPISTVTLDPGAHIPYTLQYSAGVERQVTAKSTASITYIGSRGIDLFHSRDINAPLPPDYLTRPDTTQGQVRQIESRGYQKSNSVEFNLRGRPAKFFSGQVQYTLSKTYNNTSGINYLPGNSNFPALDWARSDNDRRHKFDLLGVFEVRENLSLGAALQAYSGKPVNVITGFDNNGDGVTNDRLNGGLAPRNSLHGPGFLGLDLNAARDFNFSTDKKNGPKLTVALNAFNVLNHVNYINVINVTGSTTGIVNPQFGEPNSANPGRRLQLNLTFKF